MAIKLKRVPSLQEIIKINGTHAYKKKNQYSLRLAQGNEPNEEAELLRYKLQNHVKDIINYAGS